MSNKRSITNPIESQIKPKKNKSLLNLTLDSSSSSSSSSHRESLNNDDLFARLDDNLLYEIFKHADARNLAVFSCVSKIWNRTTQDERLWELICTRRWIDVYHSGGEKQLRSVVLALGGFRRLYSLYLSQIGAPVATQRAALPLTAARGRGKDEVNLSLSLLSIQFYEKMNNCNKNK